MAEVIDLMHYINKKKEKEVNDLAQRLSNIIESLDLESEYEMYTATSDDYSYGVPHIYTISAPGEANAVKTLSDVTDVLTKLTFQLDEMGLSQWANKLSCIVGEMFASGSFSEG